MRRLPLLFGGHSLVRPALRAFFRPDRRCPTPPRGRACQGWPRLRGHPLGLGLDRPEHGGKLDGSGLPDGPPIAPARNMPLVTARSAQGPWQRRSGPFLFAGAPAQAVALELDAMGVVNDTVQYRIAEGGIGNDVMPLRDGDLACDQERSFVVAIIDDLKEITTLLGGERLGSWAYVFKRRGCPAGLCRRAHVV